MAIEDLSINLDYRPGIPPAPDSTPEQVTRAIWEEFARIAAALQPVAPVPAIKQRGNG